MNVLLIEDDLDLGDGIRLACEAEGHRVCWVRRLADAKGQILAHRPDLLLLDLGLPDGDGHSLLAWLRTHEAMPPVLIISARDALDERLRGLDGGADDFLLKPFALKELLSRLRALARRSYGLQEGALSLGGLQIHQASLRVNLDGQPLELSPSEYRLLELLVKRADRVLTRRFLEEHALGCSQAESNVLDVHISSLRRKLGEGYIRTVRGVGYVIERPVKPTAPA